MDKNLLSVGMNRKLAKKGLGIYNLPSGFTCPGATPFCSKVCYSKKAERCYKSAREKRAWNWEQSKAPDFATRMIEEIRVRRITKVRVHESGDFYSQEYLNAWLEVVSALPEVIFLAYTKSLHLDWGKKPENFRVYASLDKTSDPKAVARALELGFPVAEAVDKGDKPVYGKVTCPPGVKKHYCGAVCYTCWGGKAPVYFEKH